jgi:hypothetical protein
MEIAGIPNNEVERLHALREYSILDTLPEQDFEDITKIASEICQTPIALITLVDSDRQWFKSNHGLNVTETPRDYAFCAHAINNPNEILTVKDSRQDKRFVDNPLVTGYPNVIFYAGVPLINPAGFSLGTICVIDDKPRELSEKQLDSLRSLSNQVVRLFEFRKMNKILQESQKEIQTRNAELEQFAYVVSHDIKSPLNNIINLTTILTNDQKGKINQEGEQVIEHITNSSLLLKSLIDGIISHYMGFNISVSDTKEINVDTLFIEIVDLLDSKREYQITYNSDVKSIQTNEVAIKQILTNLISNSIKYNDKAEVKIDINVTSSIDLYNFTIKDNGRGIKKNQFSKIFETFATLGTMDRFNNSGTGIGLATVKRLIEKLGGSITLESDIGVGTTFKFSVKK